MLGDCSGPGQPHWAAHRSLPGQVPPWSGQGPQKKSPNCPARYFLGTISSSQNIRDCGIKTHRAPPAVPATSLRAEGPVQDHILHASFSLKRFLGQDLGGREGHRPSFWVRGMLHGGGATFFSRLPIKCAGAAGWTFAPLSMRLALVT